MLGSHLFMIPQGIIGADDNNQYGITGAAPKASLYACTSPFPVTSGVRILTCFARPCLQLLRSVDWVSRSCMRMSDTLTAGVSDDSLIVDAMLRAYSDGMDVITMSLGASVAFSSSVLGDVASKIADRGKVDLLSFILRRGSEALADRYSGRRQRWVRSVPLGLSSQPDMRQ